MSPRHLILPLCISLTLVGGATFFRFSRNYPDSPQLVSVTKQNDYGFGLDGKVSQEFFNATSSPTVLTQTDIVSRELFSDYAGLVAMGQVKQGDLENLASQYAGSILNQKIPVAVSVSQISMVPDTDTSLHQYGQKLVSIRTKYKNLVSKLEISPIEAGSNSTFPSFMLATGNLYESAANELLAIETPISLAQNHINLINNYFENAEAMKALGEFSDDPVRAYAALNAQARNATEEEALLSKIQNTLFANGIILESGI